MTTAHIYMDDFVLYEAQSSRTLGDALGYVAAIVDDEADSAITRYIDALAATLQRQFRLSTQPYFHAKDIIAGRDGWQALSVFERAAVIHDVIHEAVGAGALLVYELVHEADEGFRRVREQLQTEVRERALAATPARFGISGDAKLPVASVVRGVALAVARQQAPGHIVLVEDRGVPRDSKRASARIKTLRRAGIVVTPHFDQPARRWPGLQLVDFCAAVIRLAHASAWALEAVPRDELAARTSPFGAFGDVFAQHGTFELLAKDKRTFRCVDLAA
ncbi:MAG: hypothetical protein KC503_33950 [Myxococcales bacterium]|nr:hypothetical protein [Myxococcales bacterium]